MRPHDLANMSACKPIVLLLSVACVCYLASPAASEQNCSVKNCKVLPVGEDLESEFRLKASEKGVRIIYLNLKIGNNSYNPPAGLFRGWRVTGSGWRVAGSG